MDTLYFVLRVWIYPFLPDVTLPQIFMWTYKNVSGLYYCVFDGAVSRWALWDVMLKYAHIGVHVEYVQRRISYYGLANIQQFFRPLNAPKLVCALWLHFALNISSFF